MPHQNPQYRREERNGKVVYVPTSTPESAQEVTSKHTEPSLISRLNFAAKLCQNLAVSSFNTWFPVLGLLVGASATCGLGWLSWETLTNPDVIFWVNQFRPNNLNRNIPGPDQPKTLDELMAQLKRHGKRPAPAIALERRFGFRTGVEGAPVIAIPIQNPSNCGSNCNAIQDIQLYRTLNLPSLLKLLQPRPHYRKVNHLEISGPSEHDLNLLIRSITKSGSLDGNQTALPLTTIEFQSIGSKGEPWLILSGFIAKGNATATFGQILYFNAERSDLSFMTDWISPSGQEPQWKDVTGDGQVELIVDQSIQLEPSFRVYEIQTAPNGLKFLNAIEVEQAAIAHPQYQTAIYLAKNRLWLAAQQQLQAAKADLGKAWTNRAQGQLELINLHAQVLQSEQQQTYASPIEEVQALLIQGAWGKALQHYFKSKEVMEGVEVVLGSDTGQIGDRIEFSAQNGPDKKSAIDWGILYHQAKGGSAQAQTWLKQKHPTQLARLGVILKKRNQILNPVKKAQDSKTKS